MSNVSKIIIDRLHRRVRLKIGSLVRMLEARVPDFQESTPAIADELRYAARLWQHNQDQFFHMTSDISHLTIKDICKIQEYLPPDRALLRYDLERLTVEYDEICLDVFDDVADFLIQGEAACDRGDYDIGLNILEQVIERERRLFPALLVYGHGLLEYRREYANAIKCFEMAINNLPPENPEHFRGLLLELIARAHAANLNYAGACKTLKRMANIGQDSPTIYYTMARYYCVNGQLNEAMSALEDTQKSNSSILALALTDKGFSTLSDRIETWFINLNSEWRDHAVKVLTKFGKIAELVRIYGLEKENSQIREYLGKLNFMNESVEKHGCYSLFRDILLNRTETMALDIPELVIESLEELADERQSEIANYNKSVFGRMIQRKSMLHLSSLLVWILFSCTLIIVLMLRGSTPLFASMVVAAMLPLFFIPYVIIRRVMEEQFTRRRIGIDAVNQVRLHQKDTGLIKSDLIGKINKEGWLTAGRRV